jgi:hypothetical protein
MQAGMSCVACGKASECAVMKCGSSLVDVGVGAHAETRGIRDEHQVTTSASAGPSSPPQHQLLPHRCDGVQSTPEHSTQDRPSPGPSKGVNLGPRNETFGGPPTAQAQE